MSEISKSIPRARRAGPALTALVDTLLAWFDRDARDLPWRRTDDPYAIWISEVMLQQTQVKTVIPYWIRWMTEFPTVKSLAVAKPEKVLKLWEGLGYYSRARHLHEAAKMIIAKGGDSFPDTLDHLLALPGIGRYTAGAICSIAFDRPEPILDGNVTRVLARIFAIAENARDRAIQARLWGIAGELVGLADGKGSRSCGRFNQSLMELGAVICTPRRPTCLLCPVRSHCAAYRSGCVDQIPHLGARPASRSRRFVAFLIQRGGRYLVRQRPAEGVNARLWEFPNLETNTKGRHIARTSKECLGFDPGPLEPFATIKHTITRYRITLDVLHATISRLPVVETGRWCSPTELDQLAFPSAHRQIANRITASKPRRRD